MSNTNILKRPGWVMIASIVFMLWNLFGIFAFVTDWNMTPADIAALPTEQREMWAGMGGLTWGAYAIAVLSGTAGAIGLLMKKAWAVWAFIISIAALALQFSNPIGYALGADQLQMIILPLFIIAVAVVEYFLARNWRNKGWLQ